LRLGIYGGSFDPVHIGHLLVAETVREQMKLDEIIWVPAALSPLKQANPPSSNRARLEMLRLAIGGHPQFSVDERELNRGGISYTVDTLRELHRERPDHTWFFLMGADSLIDFDRWKEPAEICRLASPIIVARGGEPPPDFNLLKAYLVEPRLLEITEQAIRMPQIQISSSELRQRASQGLSLRYRVPSSVDAYIRQHQLYR
jgi:nicotinate-nucleotide adenylyltransferase